MYPVSVSDYNIMLKTIFLLSSFSEDLFVCFLPGLSLNENIKDFGLETVQEASLHVYVLSLLDTSPPSPFITISTCRKTPLDRL